MWIGSVDLDSTYNIWLLNEDGTKMDKRTCEYVPGLFKIFDEVVNNAGDHYIRQKELAASGKEVNLVKDIKVTIDKESGEISVYNSGDGIDVVVHPEHKIYVPELIFGNMLTSTNYTEDEKTWSGLNGAGVKLCNIFSEYFEVETVDAERGKLYKQRFSANMSVIEKPKITACKKKPYTKITFKPDYARFGGGMKGLSNDMYEVMRKRVYDLCAVTDRDINIYFNDAKLEFKTFEKYVDLYIGSKSDHTRVYEAINERWEVIAAYNDFGGFEQVSFVNGLLTIRGGKHVEYIVNQIVKKMSDTIEKKCKGKQVKPQAIRDNLMVFIKCTIVNPAFDSQSKETLTTPASKFGSKAEISDGFITKLYKSGMADRVLEICALHEEKALKKTDGKKQNTIRGMPKLSDANWAGTAKSKECFLLLCEGDSASSSALAGLAEVGRDRYGVFPLKGKVMNVKDVAAQKIADNDEIANIKKILGLETGKKYARIEDLRYGGIMLLSDQDRDGFHIRGLIMNLFQSMWPSLLKDFKFVHCMNTPIVKARRGDEVVSFYSLTDFENWNKANPTGWEVKYYKGLGTSTEEEAKEWFRNMKTVTYKFTDKSEESLDLAFNKQRADDRKEWLGGYDRQVILDYNNNEIPYEDFINKELIHFSNYDVERSIPSMVDGLKISQRKILYSCFKTNLTGKEMKVAQLAAYVAQVSGYHHGEVSLQDAIVNMAQNFVGSNNINLLQPNGQLGTRLHGGQDAAQPRYIYTLLTEVATAIFKKQDNQVLSYLQDDGFPVEPEFYVPIIPMILVNGAQGIGTGFSTTIPCYNPLDITALLRRMLAGEHLSSEEDDLQPWYRGFRGRFTKIKERLNSVGLFQRTAPTQIEVSELPVGYWTFKFKTDLEKELDRIEEFKKYEDRSAGNIVSFTLHFTSAAAVDVLMRLEANGLTRFENEFGLASPKGLSTSNMYAFNSAGQITKYDTVFDIITEFYDVRLDYYQRRKEAVLQKLRYDKELMQNKIRFIREVVSESLKLHKIKKTELEAHLSENAYKQHDGSYEYITRIPVYNLTLDKVEDLEQEISKAEEYIDALEATTPQSMWLGELDEFEEIYKRFLEVGTGKPSKLAKTTGAKPRARAKKI